MRADDQRRQLAQIVIEEGLNVHDLWLRYLMNGGSAGDDELARYVAGELQLEELQRDLLSIAVRELVSERQESLGLRDTRKRRHPDGDDS